MVDVADAPVVAILTRAPSAGGKTRLFAGLAEPVDPALLEALLLDTIAGTRTPGVVQVVAVDPAAAMEEVCRLVPADVRVIAQPEGTLGDRMRLVMAQLLDGGARAVALVGSDLPDIDSSIITDAFGVLDAQPHQLVLGPATDGGYYLIGAARVPDVFDGIAWGESSVLAETLDAASRAGIPVRLLRTMPDVDTAADLDRLLNAVPATAPRTTAWARRRSYPSGTGG